MALRGLFAWGAETLSQVIGGAHVEDPRPTAKRRKVDRPRAFKPHETEEQRDARRAARRARREERARLEMPVEQAVAALSLQPQPMASRSTKTATRLSQTLRQRVAKRDQLVGARLHEAASHGATASPLHRGLHAVRPSAGLDRRDASDVDRILRQVTPHKTTIRKPMYPVSDAFRPHRSIVHSPAQASPAMAYRSPGQPLPYTNASHNMFKTKDGSNRMRHEPVSVEELVAQLRREFGEGYEWSRISEEKAARDAKIAERRLRESGVVVREAVPEETLARVRAIFKTPQDQDRVLARDFNLDVSVKDLRTLRPGQWLNDQVINYWMQLLNRRSQTNDNLPKVHCFNTFFYSSLCKGGYAGVRRWAKKAKVDIGACDVVLFPVHLSVHWCLAAINRKKKRFEYWDSLSGDNAQVFTKMREYYAAEVSAFKKEEWTDFHAPTDYRPAGASERKGGYAPVQANGYDCGMFACRTAECVARLADPDFSQSDIADMRLRLASSILDGRIY